MNTTSPPPLTKVRVITAPAPPPPGAPPPPFYLAVARYEQVGLDIDGEDAGDYSGSERDPPDYMIA